MKAQQKVVSALLAVGGMLALGWTLSRASSSTPDPGARTWEHLALVHPLGDKSKDEALGAQIRTLGSQGWELVSVANFCESGNTVKTGYYFKRPR